MFAAYSPGGRSNDAVNNGNNACCVSNGGYCIHKSKLSAGLINLLIYILINLPGLIHL